MPSIASMWRSPRWLRSSIWLVALIGVLAIGAAFWQVRQERSSPPVDAYRLAAEEPQSQSKVAVLEQGVDAVSDTLARRDPSQDGWDTEVLSERAAEQLGRLGAIISSVQIDIDASQIAELAATGIRTQPLRPAQLELVYEDGGITVHRAAQGDADAALVSGRDPFVQRIKELSKLFVGAPHVHTKFKIVSVSKLADQFRTTAYFTADGIGPTGAAQINATWNCLWRINSDVTVPQLEEISVSDYEEIVGPGTTLFVDCTAAALGKNPSYSQQLLKGTNYWRANLQKTLGMDLFGHHGLAIGDANGDQLDDLYVCQPGGLPNRLYVQNADGTAADVSAKAGVDLLDLTRSALFLDMDNDGDQDLVVMTNTRLVYLENRGPARFEIVGDTDVGPSFGISAADYDNDGDLDLYVCGYSAPRGGESAPIPYHDANNGLENRLLRNDGAWQFVDVTEQAGLGVNNQRYTLSAAWDDFDNDGDVDLYVANDFGRNNLYRNDGSTFVDIAPQAGVEDISAGMSVSWGDYDNDGLMDIYVSNMFSSAGNRVAYQRKFRTHDDVDTRASFQRHARGNTLFENVGDGTFQDVSVAADVTMGRWAWGSLFADINNDGWKDILVSNGMVSNEDTDDL